MRQGVHQDMLADAFSKADHTFLYAADNVEWDLPKAVSSLGKKVMVIDSIENIVNEIASIAKADDHILIMSNGNFSGLHEKLIEKLA